MCSIKLKHDSKEFLLSLIEALTRFKMAAKPDNAKRKTEHVTLPVIKIGVLPMNTTDRTKNLI